MSLKSTIEKEIKRSMLNKDKDRLRTLRAIKASILLAETEKGASGDLSEDVELKLLMKAAKQRKDSRDIYKEQGREDLAEVEQIELSIIEEFLPQPMSTEELKGELNQIIQESGAAGPQDMGKVMGMATKKLAGKADGKTISAIVRELLTS